MVRMRGVRRLRRRIRKKGNLYGFKSRFNSKKLAEIRKQVTP